MPLWSRASGRCSSRRRRSDFGSSFSVLRSTRSTCSAGTPGRQRSAGPPASAAAVQRRWKGRGRSTSRTVRKRDREVARAPAGLRAVAARHPPSQDQADQKQAQVEAEASRAASAAQPGPPLLQAATATPPSASADPAAPPGPPPPPVGGETRPAVAGETEPPPPAPLASRSQAEKAERGKSPEQAPEVLRRSEEGKRRRSRSVRPSRHRSHMQYRCQTSRPAATKKLARPPRGEATVCEEHDLALAVLAGQCNRRVSGRETDVAPRGPTRRLLHPHHCRDLADAEPVAVGLVPVRVDRLEHFSAKAVGKQLPREQRPKHLCDVARGGNDATAGPGEGGEVELCDVNWPRPPGSTGLSGGRYPRAQSPRRDLRPDPSVRDPAARGFVPAAHRGAGGRSSPRR